jgi:hypothetical protein
MYGFVNFVKNPLSKKYNYKSHMDICKVSKDKLKANFIDDEFKQQLKHDLLHGVTLCPDDLKYVME